MTWWSLRYLWVVGVHPSYVLVVLAAVVGLGIWTVTMNPADLDSGLGMVLFGVGSAPALAAVQSGIGVASRFPRTTRALRTALPLAAAAVLVWRAVALSGAGSVPPCH